MSDSPQVSGTQDREIMRARWRTSWARPGAGGVAMGPFRLVVLPAGGIAELALGHVGAGPGAIIRGGISLAVFFGAQPAGAGIWS